MTELATSESTKDSSRRRFFKRYESAADKYGFDPASYKGVEAFTRLLYRRWFRVQIAGLENIPGKGSAILFGNHSGGIPVDGFLLYDGIINHHSEPRRLRFLVTKLLLKAPLIGKTLKGFGCIPPDYETSTELLRKEELVFFYPEAEKGTGKLYKDRYKLAEFHAGFVRAAIETGSPLVPVATIGGDEIYPMFADCKSVAKVLDWPYYPLTPFFPWLPFPLNAVPLPVRIMVAVWRPFKLKYPPESANDENLVTEITNDIQKDIQAKVTDLLAMRTSPFAKWDMDQVNEYVEKTKSNSPNMDKHRFES